MELYQGRSSRDEDKWAHMKMELRGFADRLYVKYEK